SADRSSGIYGAARGRARSGAPPGHCHAGRSDGSRGRRAGGRPEGLAQVWPAQRRRRELQGLVSLHRRQRMPDGAAGPAVGGGARAGAPPPARLPGGAGRGRRPPRRHLEARPRRSGRPFLPLLPGHAHGPGGSRAASVAGGGPLARLPGRPETAARSRSIGGLVMQRRPLRDELRDAFDSMSEPAHPALASRIHEEIWSRPTPGVGMPRLAAVIATLVAVVVVAGLVLIGRHALPQTVPARPRALPPPATTPHPPPPPPSPPP